MPKVLRILNRFNVGGPTYNVAYLTRYLSDEYETMLIGGEKEESEASSEYMLQKLGVTYTIIPEMKRSINPFQDIKALRAIIKIIKEYKPDIVHTHAAKAGTLGRIAAAYCKVPVIIHTFHGHVFHSYFGTLKTSIFKTIERILAKKCSAIIAISDLQKHELGTVHSICKPDKINVVPLGFDLERFSTNILEKRKDFRAKYNIKEDELAIGIVGRLVPVKNHELFINAIKHVSLNSNKKIKAFIVGDGETKNNLVLFCKEIGLSFSDNDIKNTESTINFTSWIENVDEAYAGLDIVCLTSKNEGTPVSLIEAQAAGKPIVSTNVGGIENVVIEGKTALLSENNLDNFQTKLLELINNESLLKRMSENSSHLIIEKFSYKRLCTDMDKVYKKCVS